MSDDSEVQKLRARIHELIEVDPQEPRDAVLAQQLKHGKPRFDAQSLKTGRRVPMLEREIIYRNKIAALDAELAEAKAQNTAHERSLNAQVKAVVELAEQLEQRDATIAAQAEQIAKLREAVATTHAELLALPELNMANYTEDQVGVLNDGVCEACCYLESALAATAPAAEGAPE